MAGFQNDANGKEIVYCDNVDFSGAVVATGMITLDGQLMIGSSTGQAIRAGLLGSSDNSITWTTGHGTLTGQVTGGTTVGKTITGQTGGVLPPFAGNWNIFGNNNANNGFAAYSTGSGSTLTINSYGVAKWIVNTTAGLGTHTTLAAAMAAASSGDTIFLATSVTENVTITPGVNITAWTNGTANTPSITGTLTMSGAGTSNISGLELVTNSAALIALTGSAASILNVNNCFLNCTNNTGITFSSSNAAATINLTNCTGNLGTTGIGIYAHTSSGSLTFNYTNFTNTGGSSTASASSGSVTIFHSTLRSPLSFSSTGNISGSFYEINSFLQNATCITLAGTGVSSSTFAKFSSGSASALSIGAGTIFNLYDCSVNSSNTNAITGAGTSNTANIVYQTTGILNNVTTQGLVISTDFQQIVMQAFTATGTYTPTNGMKYCIIEMVGGGGGGGGSAATGAATVAAGGGGGAGSYSKGVFTAATVGASQAVTIATPAAAGGTGFAVGSNGGTTSVGMLITALGGTGGGAGSASTNAAAAGGSGGGAGSGGSINTSGDQGGSGFGSTGAGLVIGSRGAASIFGGGGIGQIAANTSNVVNGFNAIGYGSGGAGAFAGNNSASGSGVGTGGSGTKGFVLITEFI